MIFVKLPQIPLSCLQITHYKNYVGIIVCVIMYINSDIEIIIQIKLGLT